MTKHVLLNNIAHKDLKVITKKAAEYGHNIGSTITYPTEFADVQREYPILFRKDETGEFQSVALMGLDQNENLFLDESGWHASYIPAIIDRGPFLIGFQTQQSVESEQREPVIHVDMDDPRVGESEGEPVFLEHGGNSPYIERISRMLQAIHRGIAANKAMVAAFQEYDLIEPVALEIELNNGNKLSLRGFYTLNEEQLAQLDGDALAKLHHAGFLQGAFLMLASLTNIKKLIQMKNARG